MGAVRDFLQEADELFGFYFDVGMACAITRERIQKLQDEHHSSDESPFIVRDGPPTDAPEVEIERSLHSTSIGALKHRLRDNGFDLTQAAHAIVVSIFHIWDERYRRTLAEELGTAPADIKIDTLGDLRILRNSIVHNKGIASPDVAKCKVIKRFNPGDQIALSKQDIYLVIRTLRVELSKYA